MDEKIDIIGLKVTNLKLDLVKNIVTLFGINVRELYKILKKKKIHRITREAKELLYEIKAKEINNEIRFEKVMVYDGSVKKKIFLKNLKIKRIQLNSKNTRVNLFGIDCGQLYDIIAGFNAEESDLIRKINEIKL
jgi:carbamoylphosphate synthase small subunit